MAATTDSKLASFLWDPHQGAAHACQVYASEPELLDTLTGYAGGALWNGESVIIVATNRHCSALETRLRESGLDLGFLRANDRFITASAEITLARICVAGWPEDQPFRAVVEELVGRAGAPRRRVRIYGEMVALLWAQGKYAAALQLERLWNGYLEGRALPLLCAYPRQDLSRAPAEHIAGIEKTHSLFVR